MITPAQNYSGISQIFQTSTSQTSIYGLTNNSATTGQAGESTDPSISISPTAKAMSTSDAVYPMDTNKGKTDIDLNSYFEPQSGPVDLDSIPLLMPTASNIETLQNHISSVMPDFLSEYGIPEAPSSIQYDMEGKIVLPADYPYSEEFKDALEQEPQLAKQLQTVNALASHYAAMQESLPFHEAASQAESQAELDAIIEQFSYLFDDNRRYPEITLQFSKEGSLSVQGDGSALV